MAVAVVEGAAAAADEADFQAAVGVVAVAVVGRAAAPQGGSGGDGDDGGRGVGDISRTECEADRMTLAAMDDSLRLDRIADAANRAVTSFYTVYARAIAADQTPNGKPPAVVANEEQDPASRMDAMRQLATTTDGMAVMTSAALDGAITRISSDMSGYDILTYHSTNKRLDGKFRSDHGAFAASRCHHPHAPWLPRSERRRRAEPGNIDGG